MEQRAACWPSLRCRRAARHPRHRVPLDSGRRSSGRPRGV